MTAPKLVMPEYVSLKNHPDIREKWLQDELVANPKLLGLDGELVALRTEITQPSGGRLDLLLADHQADVRYEVEIQLGPMDPHHIIRTIEYWNIERQRYPQFEHRAVIVAEKVTGRYFNVISLLNSNRTIPLIAIQIQAMEVNGGITLVATRVIDLPQPIADEDDSGGVADKAYWAEKSSAKSVDIVDGIIERIRKIIPEAKAKYTKAYIIPEYDGSKFVEFWPNRGDVRTGFIIPQDDELTERMEGSEIRFAQYKGGKYWVNIRQSDLDDHGEILDELIGRAYVEAGGMIHTDDPVAIGG